MQSILVLCLALAVCSAVRLPVPYSVYVRNGGQPLPETLRTGKWYLPDRNSTAYIVGGEAAKAGDVPWICALLRTSLSCGCSIIDANTILTAAHCVDGTSNPIFETAGLLRIRVGSLRHASGGTLIQVKEIRKHPGYSESTMDNDVAILKLSSPISIDGINIKAITLPTRRVADNQDVVVAGWGTLRSGGTLPANLQMVTVPIVSLAKCRSAYGASAITNQMICAGIPAGGKDSCQGDSGGPLTVGSVQYGVVSWGNGCAQRGYPGVYANVFALKDWINSNKN